jgi:aspartate/methionine/tyrosine aminotransferase
VPVHEDDGFQYRPEEIAKSLSPRTKAILINSPANPTGQLLSPERMQAIAEMAPGKEGPPYVISDEIYHGLCYEGKEHSILEFIDSAFVLNGFSKIFAMTGWRLGYLISPEHYMRPLQKMHQNFAICAPSVAQWAGVAALKEAEADCKRMQEKYNARRLRLVQGLKDLGFGIKVIPTGAFYVLARCDHLDPDDYSLAFDILEKAGVACTPGCDFGPGGRGFLRFSYANSLENIEEGLRRLREYLTERQSQCQT